MGVAMGVAAITVVNIITATISSAIEIHQTYMMPLLACKHVADIEH